MKTPIQLPFDLSADVGRSRIGLVLVEDQPAWAVLYEETLPDFTVNRPSGFPFHAVEIILSGRGTYGVDAAQPLATGNFFCYGPGMPVGFAASRRSPIRKFFIAELNDRPEPLSWLRQLPAGTLLHMDNPDLVRQLLDEALFTSRRAFEHAQPVSMALLNAVGAILLRSTFPAGNPDRGKRMVERALNDLEQHLISTRSVADWAARLEVSPEHLSRTFRRFHTRTPYAELTDRKLSLAYHLLITGVGNVQEVARRIGFDDPFHFSRLFTKRMGLPPSALIRR